MSDVNSFRDKTVQGVGWSVISQVGYQSISFLTVAILARRLSPYDFGMLAMITVVTHFATNFAELGFSAALVQNQKIDQRHLSSVFWLNVGTGMLLTLLFMAGAPLLAAFYNEPALIPLSLVMALNFVIVSFSIVQQALLLKALDFRRLSIVNLVAAGIAATVAIAMAYAGAGVWSLVAQALLLSTITTLMVWRLTDWRPALLFDRTAIHEMLGFSLSQFGNGIFTYWVRNIDYLLIGRYLGAQPLGVYRNAYTVMLLPLNNVSRVIARVMFPTLALIQDDKARVKQLFLRATRTIALITFPMMAGLFVVIEPFVLTVFGAQWAAMIPILRVFCLTGLLQSVATLTGNLYLSQGKADLQLRIGLLLHSISAAGIIIGLRWGALGVAIGYTLATLINLYPSLRSAGSLVNLTYWEVWGRLLPILGCALTMAVAIWGIGLYLPPSLPDWAYLLIQIPCGVAIYGALIHLCKVQAYVEMRSILVEQWSLRQRKPHSEHGQTA